jgi:cysteine desulfurase/selenocysteine lyase
MEESLYNIKRIRNDFPALNKILFFASAGVGPLPRSALVVMQKYNKGLRIDFSKKVWEEDPWREVRELAARLIHASPEEITLTPSTSTGINLLAGSLDWKQKDNIVLNDLEYPANVYPWIYQADLHDLEIRMVPSKNGVVSRDDLLKAIDKRTRVLAVSHVEFGTGYRNDVAALAEAVHKVNGLICVDAIQSLGVLKVDVKALDIDVLATGGYKWLCGPLGTGFAYVREDLLTDLKRPIANYMNLPSEDGETVWNALVAGKNYPTDHASLAQTGKRFEDHGLSPTLFKGFATALEYLLALEEDAIESRISELVSYCIERLCEEKIELITPKPLNERAGIVTLRVPFDLSRPKQVAELETKLRDARIKAHPRAGGLRLSIHFFNTTQDIDRVVNFIKKL